MPVAEKVLELLGQVDLFSSLTKTERSGLAAIAAAQNHPAGRIIFRPGEKSDGFHVVLSGRWDCYLWDELFKIERLLATLKRGETFGEIVLLTDETRSAFIRAQEESETVFFEKKPFFQFLEKKPKIVLEFARILARRLVATSRSTGIKFTQLTDYKIGKDLAQLLPLQLILRHRILPIEKKDNDVTLAIVDPADQLARNTAAQFLSRKNVNWVCVSATEFDNFRDKQLFDLVNEQAGTSAPIAEEISYVTVRGGTPIEATSEAATALDSFLSNAINAGASDLHLEPGPPTV